MTVGSCLSGGEFNNVTGYSTRFFMIATFNVVLTGVLMQWHIFSLAVSEVMGHFTFLGTNDQLLVLPPTPPPPPHSPSPNSIETFIAVMTATAMKMSQNNNINKQTNGSARASYTLVHFFAVLYKTTMWNNQLSG